MWLINYLFPAGFLAGGLAAVLGVIAWIAGGWLASAITIVACYAMTHALVGPRVKRRVAEDMKLMVWGTMNDPWIKHFDPSARDGTYRGTLLDLINAYRNVWTFEERLTLMQGLRDNKRGDGRNPDNGKLFSIWIDDKAEDEISHGICPATMCPFKAEDDVPSDVRHGPCDRTRCPLRLRRATS